MCHVWIYLRQAPRSSCHMPKEKHNFLFIYLHQLHVMLENPKIGSIFVLLWLMAFSLSVTPTVCPLTE